jgi:hypothetical protein
MKKTEKTKKKTKKTEEKDEEDLGIGLGTVRTECKRKEEK